MFDQALERFKPKSTWATIALLMWVSGIQSASLGFDASMINGLNILPSYTEYFELTTATLALQSAIGWAGAMVSGFFYGWVTEVVGRRNAIYICGAFAICGSILQASSQNVAMFSAARFIAGAANGAAYVCGPTYLAETLPMKWRAIGLGTFMNFYYVGGLLSAGITYGSFKLESTWAWRLPSALIGVICVISLLAIPLVPESPRWLAYHGRLDEALAAVSLTHADGDCNDPVVLSVMEEIQGTLKFEAEHKESVTFSKAFQSKSSCRRLALVTSVAVITMLSGNNIISFYLGSMLTNAGITSADTQLQINIYLNLWCLALALAGTSLLDRVGRKILALTSTTALTVFIFIFGALTKVYGDTTQTSAVYGTVAVLFLFQGAYSFAWTPLAMLYPPEILHYSLRSTGMGMYAFWVNGFGLLATMAFPFALEAITWKTYMVNGAWDVVQVVYIAIFWVETKGKTLEEIDALFDGVKYGDAPDILEAVPVDIDGNIITHKKSHDDDMDKQPKLSVE